MKTTGWYFIAPYFFKGRYTAIHYLDFLKLEIMIQIISVYLVIARKVANKVATKFTRPAPLVYFPEVLFKIKNAF